jgi:hypothetical protein
MRLGSRDKAGSAVSLLSIQSRKIIIPILLFIGLASLTSLASAQRCDRWMASEFSGLTYSSSADQRTDGNWGTTTCNPSEGKQSNLREAALLDDKRDAESSIHTEKRVATKSPDFNRDIYFRNKLEFAFDVGWLPINVPFPFDILEGDPYELYPLRYTLVPILASLRWQVNDVGGPWIFRGNWDITATASATAIPRGAETHYFSYDMGIRRNFVPRTGRVAPYVDIRAGLGLIDAKGPLGVYYAQGQNYTFTMNMGAGARYNFNSRYGISAGLNWMHISNNNLSSPQYSNYGINVYGPMFGLDITLHGHPKHSDQ